nr:methyltransferase domain-containing selenoprotein MduS [Paucidesulfovibrio longus]
MTPEHKPKKEQKSHWDEVFTESGAFFGEEPSQFAKVSLNLFQQNNVISLLELGCGQGRDSFLFAQNGLNVTGLDYSESAVAEVSEKAANIGLSSRLRTQVQDLREPLPFTDESFDACYSHMLLCMELSTAEIAFILRETHRILKPGGLAVYSVRSSFDKHYRTGTHLGEDIYEIGDFVVHFFTEGKVRQLAKGYEILKIERMEEGGLPRDLFCVSMKKGSVPSTWDLDPCEETSMSDPLDKFQAFMDASLAPGALDHKTKQLVALGAALAAGCDP